MNKNMVRTKTYLLFGFLGTGLVIVFLLSIGLGSVRINFKELLQVIFNIKSSGIYHSIVWQIRLPRILGAIIGGAALAVAGLFLQIFFRNPIVGPFVLGISSGATLSVGLVILSGLTFGLTAGSPYLLFSAAFVGSLIVMTVVVLVAREVKNVVTLLVIGLMVGYLCNALTSLLMAFAEKEEVHGFVMWTLGSFSGITWDQVKILSIIGIPFLLATFLVSKPLNALLLGENYARSMGVNINKVRILIVIISSTLAGIVTAFAGPVAFIGLAVPHITRLLFGTSDNRILIPAAILSGGMITALCDLLARMIFAPVELPVSAVTSFFGAPIVIYLLLKRRAVL